MAKKSRKSTSSKRHRASGASKKGIDSSKFRRVAPPGFRTFDAMTSAMEKKYLDTPIQSTATTYPNGDLYNLCVIPQGDQPTQRTGNKVTVTNINVQGHITICNTLGRANYTRSVMARVILLVDTQVNGALPNVSDIFSTPPGTLPMINAWRNPFAGPRFVFLKEKLFVLSPVQAVSAAADAMFEASRVLKMSWKGRLNLTYDQSATTGVIASLRSNGIYVLILTDEDPASTVQLKVNLNARLKFTDF